MNELHNISDAFTYQGYEWVTTPHAFVTCTKTTFAFYLEKRNTYRKKYIFNIAVHKLPHALLAVTLSDATQPSDMSGCHYTRTMKNKFQIILTYLLRRHTVIATVGTALSNSGC
jgi:hypothetical protein